MDLLIGSNNPSKITMFRDMIAQTGLSVRLLTLQELGIRSEPAETGRTPLENAVIKARFYRNYCDNVITDDAGFYLADLDPDDPRQPGLNVRTPQDALPDDILPLYAPGIPRGHRLDNEEMAAYYINLVKRIIAEKQNSRASSDPAGICRSLPAYFHFANAIWHNNRMYTYAEPLEEALQLSFPVYDHILNRDSAGWPIDWLTDSDWHDSSKSRLAEEQHLRRIRFIRDTLS